MAFSPAFIDELIARNPIEDVVGQQVALTRKGANLFGLCPFHGEKTASFSVAPEKGIYYCFGCHKGGGVINFIMETENLGYPDAVRFLAKRAGLEVPEDDAYQSQYKKKERLWALNKETARYFHAQMKSAGGAQVRDYVKHRGLSAQTVTRFGLGFAPNAWTRLLDAMTAKGYSKEELLEAGLVLSNKEKGTLYDRFRNRLMFPIIDVRGNVIGFGGRVMDDSTPKYLNSPETTIFNKRRNLFAMNVAKKSKRGMIILTEGYMDAIALHQHGFDCAVASLGTSLTQEHADLLSKYTNEIVLTYDADAAGQNATARAIPMLEKTGLRVKVLRMQGAKDPDEFLEKYGADRFKILLEGSENQAEYRLRSLQMQFDMAIDEQKVAFAQEAAALISTFTTAVEREVYGVRAAEAAGLTPEVMKLEITKAFERRIAREKKAQEKRDLAPAAALQPKSRELRYDNVRSAVAEENLLRMLLREPALFDQCGKLDETQFSVPTFGKVFARLFERWRSGLSVLAASLEGELSPPEMAHLTAVLQKAEQPLSEDAFRDCLRIIEEEYRRSQVSDEDSLLAMQQSLKKKKGYGGT
ncbi:MAG: DNA primase [Oscillospiraceae bacterium]|jgi:DNA primase|nr:DNA primase [Oscillospiraceae bacterium]